MTGDKTGWLMILLAGVLVLQVILLIKVHRTGSEEEIIIQRRDSVMQAKIDSLNTNISNYFDQMIFANDLKLGDVNKKISINKTAIKRNEKELLQNNTSDSVYNWIKSKLHARADFGR